MIRRVGNRRSVVAGAVAAFLVATAGCSKQTEPKPLRSQPAPEAATQPAPPPARPAEAPAQDPEPVATQPVATRPAQTQPASTYDAKPPYPVRLYVRRPEDEQPGWLRILKRVDEEQAATSTGTFPEKNRIYVDTQNVQQIRIHVGHLPLGERKPIVLHIDEQVIQLSRKRGDFRTLARTRTGIWKVVKSSR